jgi:hypothetical protein
MVEATVQVSNSAAGRRGYVLCPDAVLIPFEDGTLQMLDLDGSFLLQRAFCLQLVYAAVGRYSEYW